MNWVDKIGFCKYTSKGAKMKKIIVLMLVFLPALLFAQSSPVTPSSQNPYAVKKSSLFDPSKLSMHQSYSFGYYSGGGTSGSLGYYLNSIEYSFSNPLKIRIDLGFLHSPSSILGGKSSVANSEYLFRDFLSTGDRRNISISD